MPTHLSLDDHVAGIERGGAALRAAAAAAGLTATVPTCPGWNVTDLVAHQGMVHRWAAAQLRGETDHRVEESRAAAEAAADLLAWYADGLAALLDTVRATPDDAAALVFLNDAPPPRRFWARRQAHETTMHGVDAISAGLGRWPTSADVDIDPALAADGIDELLCGFITRERSGPRAAEPYRIVVRIDDTGHCWTVRVSDRPVVTTAGAAERPDAVFSGTAVQLYLSLWNRSDEMTAQGRVELVDEWRSQVRVRWA